MRFEYKVTPFVGALTRNVFSDEGYGKIAAQLQNLINLHSVEGWEFVRVEDISIRQNPGCLAAIFTGKGSNTYTLQVVVFRKAVLGRTHA